MDAAQVEGDGGQGELGPDSVYSPGAELPHVALLLEHSEDRFHDGFSSRILAGIEG
jgi:hypothetical protein